MTTPMPLPNNRLAASVVPTFAALIEACDADEALSATRRTNLRSSLKTLCRKLDRRPADTLASAGHLRRYLEGVHPVQLGLSVKRWQNVLADVRFALDRFGPVPVRRLNAADLTPAWRALFEALPQDGLHHGLSRFIRFCSTVGIEAKAVDDTVFVRFEAWLGEVEFQKQPARSTRAAINQWTKACDQVAGWPGRPVERAPARDLYSLPWDAIDPLFRADAEQFLTTLGADAWWNTAAPLRPLRPASIESHRYKLRSAYSILTTASAPAIKVTGLADLVDPENAQRILMFHWNRNGGRPSSQLAGIAALLLSIARHHVHCNNETVCKLQHMKARVSPARSGLTDKNRTMLRQFDDPANIGRLLMLPSDLAREATGIQNSKPRKAALLMQTAVAVEILTMMPLRISNLVALNTETELSWHAKRLVIAIAPENVKNDEAIEFALEGDSAALVRRYLDQHRHLLGPDPDWLFPGAAHGRHKSQEQLARQIKTTVFRVTGLTITPHQFRHVAARIWLDDNPGSYDLLRRLLRHRSVDTTTNSYSGFETCRAVEHFDHLILQLRARFMRGTGIR